MGPVLEEGEGDCRGYSGMMRCRMCPRASRQRHEAFGASYAHPSALGHRSCANSVSVEDVTDDG